MKVVLKPKRVESTASYHGGFNMANGIDLGTLAVGAALGVGLHKQIKSAAKISATFAANLAASTAAATAAACEQAVGQNSQNFRR